MDKKSTGFLKSKTWKRVLSFCMAVVMLLALVPVTAMAADTMTLYFRNDWLWTDVCVYYWGAGNVTWPGVKMTKIDQNNGLDVYSCTIPAGVTGVIFNGIKNDGTGTRDQTPDILDAKDGNAYYIHWNEKNMVSLFDYTPPGGGTTNPSQPTTPTTKPNTDPIDVTVHYRNTGLWSEVYYHAWIEDGDNDTGLTNWPGEKLTETTGHSNWYTLTLNDLDAPNGIGVLFNSGTGSQTADIPITAGGEYWYDGALTTTAPASWEDGSVEVVDYEVTLHFANSYNWSNVNLYTWGPTGQYNGAWPGTAAGLDNDGFYSLNFTYQAPSGQGLNFIFNGGPQTVDLVLPASAFVNNKAEKWVVPTVTDSEGKYYADIVDHPDAIAISPVVDGNKVTFEYKDANATSVSVAGTMNGWSTTANPMTKNAHGVWSTTIENVDYGTHEYKFVVGENWVIDPLNSWVITETSGNQNSAFLISNPELDVNTVTINVHYDRADGNYENWNAYVWTKDMAGRYDLTDKDGDMVTVIEVDGRATQSVSFKLRKSVGSNDWVTEEPECRVDLSTIVSGTIDVFVTRGTDSFTSRQQMSGDVVTTNKVTSVELDYDKNTVTIQTVKSVNDPETAFDLVNSKNASEDIIKSISTSGSTYTLTLNKTLDLVTLYQYTARFNEQVKFTDYAYKIGIKSVYASDKFAEEYTYTGTDLGATYSATETKFVLWAPTAEAVQVKLYTTGSDAEEGAADLGSYSMNRGNDGTWTVTIKGVLKNVYYTYIVSVNGKQIEACDPYARTTGVNGNRAMVVDLESTNPTGWDTDKNPNRLKSYTDAVIYELHVRDFSIDDSSGISEANRGKFMAFTETGTTVNGEGSIPTGVDYLKELGITHLHLLPIYDYGSVKEDKLDVPQFNWGYDPQNYNVPEGSYSTNPYDGNVRVAEMKQMVSSLHNAGISVIMDVVYNHVYDAGKFCFNQIVPNYFSRNDSNTSGCGNDTASEREMVRKYIVESILYWADEYHIDGFRFDLVGLLDVETINQIVTEVHKTRPDVIFYGEGWNMDSTNSEPGTEMARQGNSAKTPGFAYFSDSMRNGIAGDNGNSLGFVSGQTGAEGRLVEDFLAKPVSWGETWTTNPQQVVQYVSCHDNYTLADKLIISTGKSGMDETLIKMNNLSAAIYMMSQGIPFIHAGEEFLREKVDENGVRSHNSYNASDYVNHIEWSNLKNSTYLKNSQYYKGLVEFRKNHAALRLPTAADIAANVTCTKADSNIVMFTINGGVNGEVSDKIAVIFNANQSAVNVNLPAGTWKVCIDGQNAGTDVLYTKTGSVSVAGISAMVLVQGETVDTHTHNHTAEVTTEPGCETKGVKTFTCECGDTYTESIPATGHSYVDGVCSVCGAKDPDYAEPVTGSITLTGVTLSLEDEVLYNLYFTTSDMTVSADKMGLLVWDSEPTNATINGGATVIPGATVSGSTYMVQTNGIPGKNLGDNLYLVAYAQLDNGAYVYSKVLPYSAKSYCMSRLEKSSDAKLKALCVALLNYGAAAQEYFAATSNYTYTTLMNADLTAEQQALVQAYNSSMMAPRGTVTAAKAGVFGTTNNGYSARSASMSADGIFSINYYFTTANATSNVTMYYWNEADFNAVSELTVDNATGSKEMTPTGTANQFWADIDGIAAKDLDKTIYACGVYTVNGTTYSTGVIPYSLGHYCSNKAEKGGDEIKPMAAATAVYSYYAKLYFNK